ncbi:phosphodiester glycosidase family protein [Lutispora sp.]|uniref:phosphodiester glycosidase family protein n=1 Tax=Lutispora sp. TaxID=2828727 RepID=UPI0035675F6C
MKKIFTLILAISIIFNTLTIVYSAPENVGVGTHTIKVADSNKTVNVVTIDLNSPDMVLEVVTANDKVSGSEDFMSMINRKKPIAAINANFFDAYSSLEPYGSIIKNKEFIYLEGKNASLFIQDKNKVDMDYFKVEIDGYLDGKRQNEWNNVRQAMDFNLFKVWYINNLSKDSTGVYIYTPARGTSIWLETGTAIEVIENKITKVTKNPKETIIPSNGYIIYYAANAADDKYINDRFRIGRTVELSYKALPALEDSKEKSEEKAAAPAPSAKQTLLYGCVDKETKNYWDNAKNGMDFNLFNVWYINSKPIDSTGVYLYTPERGSSLSVPEGKAITVSNKRVSKIDLKTTNISIPKDGFVIYYGKDAANDDYINQRFAVGKTVDFFHKDTLVLDTDNIIKKAVADNTAALAEAITQNTEAAAIDIQKVEHMISAGPYLVKDGKIIADAVAQGFKEDKITVNRAQRSAIGITKDNKLKLVTGGNLNMTELAQVMLELGCVKAMNLDGGASSALYAKGKMITAPGRKLNTVLMILDVKQQ